MTRDTNAIITKKEVVATLQQKAAALDVEINAHGLLEWDAKVDYEHPAAVMGIDGEMYKSRSSSGPNAQGSVDPAALTGSSKWKKVVDVETKASTTKDGLIKLATDADTLAGTNADKAVTPAKLASRTATENRSGIARVASTSEVSAGTDDTKIVTPAKLANVTSTEIRRGLVELATQAEADAGTDAERAMTPALVKRRIDAVAAPADASTSQSGIVELADDLETRIGSDGEKVVTPAGLASVTSTDTRRGLVELATQVESDTGTDTSRAMTPSLVQRAIGRIADATTAVRQYVDCCALRARQRRGRGRSVMLQSPQRDSHPEQPRPLGRV